jgi:hypothetical protein
MTQAIIGGNIRYCGHVNRLASPKIFRFMSPGLSMTPGMKHISFDSKPFSETHRQKKMKNGGKMLYKILDKFRIQYANETFTNKYCTCVENY